MKSKLPYALIFEKNSYKFRSENEEINYKKSKNELKKLGNINSGSNWEL